MSIKFIASLILGGGVFLGIYLGYNYVTNLQETVQEQSKEISKLEISNKTLEKQKQQTEKDLLDANKRSKVINQKFKKSRDKANELEKLFSDHDFARLVKAKPEWMEKKINKGTQEVLEELETISK